MAVAYRAQFVKMKLTIKKLCCISDITLHSLHWSSKVDDLTVSVFVNVAHTVGDRKEETE